MQRENPHQSIARLEKKYAILTQQWRESVRNKNKAAAEIFYTEMDAYGQKLCDDLRILHYLQFNLPAGIRLNSI